jgi:hypothetical protein
MKGKDTIDDFENPRVRKLRRPAMTAGAAKHLGTPPEVCLSCRMPEGTTHLANCMASQFTAVGSAAPTVPTSPVQSEALVELEEALSLYEPVPMTLAATTPAFRRIRQTRMIRAYASIRAAYADYLRWHEDPSGNVVGITSAGGGATDSATCEATSDSTPSISQAFVDWIQDVLPELEKDYALSRQQPKPQPARSDGHCFVCGETNVAYRNGRCGNVPGSSHDWRKP